MLTRSRIILIAIAALPLYVVYDYVKLQYWRERLEAMCYEDGGNTIYETVVVPKEVWERFSTGNYFSVPWDRDKDTKGHPYKYRVESESVKSGNPTIRRSTSTIYRVLDGHDLGKFVQYSMAAAPLLNFLSAFRFSCNSMPGFNARGIEQEIFIKGD